MASMAALLVLSAQAGCSSDGSPATSGTGAGQGGSAGSGGAAGNAAGQSGQGGASGAAGKGNDPCANKSCDDGIACTLDTCQGGECVHKVDATACPKGQYCTVEKGCVGAPACANDQQCADAWKSDPCKANPRCDAASAVCIFDPLDKDKDGHSPLVCGGDDCDDSDAKRFPGNLETCDQRDDDCDGDLDLGATCSGLLNDIHDPYVCVSGACQCKPEFLCGQDCAPHRETNAKHCGACFHACSPGESCKEGQCACDKDLQNDPENCGACGHACSEEEVCVSGSCQCPAGPSCDGHCVGDSDSANCGACGKVCPFQAPCSSGVCQCANGGTACGEFCVDTASDTENCGGCGKPCPAGADCVGGSCACPGQQTVCGDACIDTTFDPENCGGCGQACGPVQNGTALCGSSGCVASCASGFADCDGSFANGCEVDTGHDPKNCGGCGDQCAPGASCGESNFPPFLQCSAPWSCGDLGSSACFGNFECAADERCSTSKPPNSAENVLSCCEKGPRGKGLIGTPCASREDCASGACIGDPDGGGAYCSDLCFDWPDCAAKNDKLGACSEIEGSQGHKYCFFIP